MPRGTHRWRWYVGAPLLALLLLLLPACGSFRPLPVRTVAPLEELPLPAEDCDGFFLLPVHVNGRGPYTMLLDTGAAAVVVDDDLAATDLAHLSRPFTMLAVGAGGGTERIDEALRIDSLRIGSFEVGGLDAAVLDLDPTAGALGTRIDGILGMPVFADVLLTLDYPAGRVSVATGSLPPPDGQTVLSSRPDSATGDLGGAPTIEIRIGGRTIPVAIDTGMSGTLALRERDAPPTVGATREIAMIHAVGGKFPRRAARLGTDVVVGRYVLRNPVVELERRRSLMGTGVLRHFRVTFDQAGGRVALVRPGDEPVPVEGARGIGVSLSRLADRLIVTAVFPGTPAEAAGIRVGDAIRAVDGRPVADLQCWEKRSIGRTGAMVHLLIERQGAPLELSVAVEELVP